MASMACFVAQYAPRKGTTRIPSIDEVHTTLPDLRATIFGTIACTRCEVSEHVDLERLAHPLQGDVDDGPALHDARVQYQDVGVEGSRVSDVDVVERIELDRIRCRPLGLCGLRPQAPYLRPGRRRPRGTAWPWRASSIEVPRPNPELAPVIRIFFVMSPLYAGMPGFSLEGCTETASGLRPRLPGWKKSLAGPH
ncbi:hypothetical protein SMICM304S_05353 [Streptomyces microflavus]